MFTLTDSAAQGVPLTDFPAPAGRVVGEAFESALDTNPVPLFMQAQELNAAKGRGYVMPKDEAEQEVKRSGVAVKVPDAGISQPALSILIERRHDDAARELLFSRSPDGIAVKAGTFGASMAATLLDPVNAAVGFVPVLGGTRYAAKLAEAGTAVSRLALRTGVGAAEGLVGAAALELPTLQLRRDLQDDYSLYDSLANIAFGTLASAGIRGVGGAIRDRYLGLAKARLIDAARAVEPGMESATLLHAGPTGLTELRGRYKNPPQIVDGQVVRDVGREGADAPIYLTSDPKQAAWINENMPDRGQGVSQRTVYEAEVALQNPKIIKTSNPENIPFPYMNEAAVAKLRAKGYDGIVVSDSGKLADAHEVVVFDPTRISNLRDTAASVSSDTHAQALKVAVAQAVEGRQIDVDPVLRSDKAFGNRRVSGEEVVQHARANMAPEAKVGGDKQASERAIQVIEERGGGGKAKPHKAVPGENPPEHAEVDALLSETKADFDALHEALADYKPTPAELLAHGLAKADASDAALVAEALHLASDRVEAAAVQFRDDEAKFLQAVKEIVGAEREKPGSKAGEGGQGDQRSQGPGGSRPAEGKAASGTGEARDPEVVRAEAYARAYEALGGCAQAGGL